MPKNFKQWILAIVLVYLAFSALKASLDVAKDPFPELTKDVQEATEGAKELEQAIKEANELEKEREGAYISPDERLNN